MPEDPYIRLSPIGRCTIDNRVGNGGMGVVYRGRHKDLDLDVALKFLHPHLTQAAGTSDRFLREARLAARLQCGGIVRVFDCGEANGHYYIVMEYVDGQTLAEHLKERDTLPVARALQIIEAVAQALQMALDQIGLIHRDIKPANILITNSGQVKLADLGLAKVVSQKVAENLTNTGAMLGTPRYMSPEQFVDASRIDHRADMFSLGATLYELLTGQHAFDGGSIFEVMKAVMEVQPNPLPSAIPLSVHNVVGRMLAKSADQRYQNYVELLDALQAAQKSLGDTMDDVSTNIAAICAPVPATQSVCPIVRPATPNENRVLLVVDVQNDFCPDGALAVPGGDEIVPIINKIARRFSHVILTQDWHRDDHLSFASSHPGAKPFSRIHLSYGDQILWPDHCVGGTPGAEFHPKLDIPHCEMIIRKGYNREIDSYSAFFENDRRTPTGLTGYLRERGLTRLFLVGLATDFCVAHSALDARRLGFEVTVIEAGCRSLDVHGSLAAAWQQMLDAGVNRV